MDSAHRLLTRAAQKIWIQSPDREGGVGRREYEMAG